MREDAFRKFKILNEKIEFVSNFEIRILSLTVIWLQNVIIMKYWV